MRTARGIYDTLLSHYGPQGWWPADSPFEVFVGAMLMAQTAWPRVAESIGNLRRAGLLNARSIAEARIPRLRRLVAPAGLHGSKPGNLRVACRAIVDRGGLPRFLSGGRDEVRDRLLALRGVGDETADSILLYAARFPVFVVDAYTRRIGRRLGLFDDPSYRQVQSWFESRLPRNPRVFREYHALLVAHAKTFCRPRPRCAPCPLLPTCEHGSAQFKRLGASGKDDADPRRDLGRVRDPGPPRDGDDRGRRGRHHA